MSLTIELGQHVHTAEFIGEIVSIRPVGGRVLVVLDTYNDIYVPIEIDEIIGHIH